MATADIATPRNLEDILNGAKKTFVAKSMKNYLGFAMLILGVFTLIPSAMGVAQYTTRANQESEDNKGLYVGQSIILSIAVVIIVVAIIILAMKRVGKLN